MMKIIRVFPRRTNATPDDDLVRFDVPGWFDIEPDEVHVSVTFDWDKERGEWLAEQWRRVAPVYIGGPAYNDPGDEFTPGLYLKKGYVFTSRGCPNHCWFCVVPKREGGIRELEIKDGWNLLDSNLLACSDQHIKAVFAMLKRQNHAIHLTGGLEAARLKEWHVEEMAQIKPHVAFFAYDTPHDYEPLLDASKLLKRANLISQTNHSMRCYVLIGWKNDTIENAEKRLQSVLDLGFMPMAMLYNAGAEQSAVKVWRRFQREWASPIIVGSKMKTLDTGKE